MRSVSQAVDAAGFASSVNSIREPYLRAFASCAIRAIFRRGARNGFAEPRDWAPKSTLSRPHWRQRPARPIFEPRKRPQIAGYSPETERRRFGRDCVVDLRGL